MYSNSLAPERCVSNFKSLNLKLIIDYNNLATQCIILPRWMPQNLTDEKSALVQEMAWGN